MRKFSFILAILFGISLLANTYAGASEVDILVKKLVEKKLLTQDEAKEILEETKKEAVKEKEASKDAEKKTYSIPEWTQKINIKGDVRFRIQPEWGKGLNPSHIRVRERMRARLGVEAKVNETISAGARLVTGGTADPRSTNITLGDSTAGGDFSKTGVSFDQYYIKFQPDYKYLTGSKLWLGKFPNPFDTTELVWDPDINPEGIAFQYMSPFLDIGYVPKTKIYANGGVFWLLEIAKADTDPMMWGAQTGFISQIYPEFGTTLDVGAAIYDVTRMQNRNWATVAAANTNSLQTLADAEFNPTRVNTLKYDYQPLDLIVKLDNKRLFSIEAPNGLYSDFVYNNPAANGNIGYMFGGYVGERNIKEFGQWNAWFEWRYLGRDSVPDIMPDSDFYGFTPTGAPAGGGTNTRGINTGVQFGLFKNTFLSLRYSWSEPIKSSNSGQGTASVSTPYQVIYADINARF